METNWRLVICATLVATFPLASIAVFSGPLDTTVLFGDTAVLNCSNPEFVGPGITQWSKDGTTIANAGGVFDARYPSFQVITSSSTPTTRLDLRIPNAQVSYEGSYECQITPDTGTAQLSVEMQGDEPAIMQTSNGNLTEGIRGELTCTTAGYRPPVSLAWYRNGSRIQTGVTETQSAEKADGTTDTTSVWTFTPTRDFNEDTIQCRTVVTDRIAASQTGILQLDVRYAPVVTVMYSNKVVVCCADSNPLADNYEIIFNETDVKETYPTSGQSYSFVPDSCTYITCNVTNAVGTGVGEVGANPICPGYVDPSSAAPTITDEMTTPARNETQGLTSVGIVFMVIGHFIVITTVVAMVAFCYKKRLYCFASSNTKNGTKKSSRGRTTELKPQPFVKNEDGRQNVNKYEEEPKEPLISRNTNVAGSNATGKHPTASASSDRQPGYIQDKHDETAESGKMYAGLDFQVPEKNSDHPPSDEPTQYASITV